MASALLQAVLVRRLPLDRAAHQPADKVLAQQDVDDQRRHRGDQCTGHRRGVVGELAAGQKAQRNGHRSVASRGEERGKQVVIPGGGELPDQYDHEARCGDREDHRGIGAQDSCPVHACGLDELGGHRLVVVAEDQRTDRQPVNDVQQHQRGNALGHAQGAHQLGQRDHDRLVGDEHAKEDQREHHIGAREAPFGEHIAVDRAQRGGDDRGGDHQGEGTSQRGGQRGPGLGPAGGFPGGGQEPGA
ncbi:hypothetical protein B879_04190 [Cecembia lonarensis LW9]|uniref:Uncharacterized protein n=1 Tax=Cecembia lonarensis (strain CCUG 58316 / KCTC 22772 / LW9) TaxID=1225176 RepID=K1KXL8_CECL9|nr:hypothetical protein B879_04190 [Cecembia lonarensis LW9]